MLRDQGLVDPILGAGTKKGYVFEVQAGAVGTWLAVARPAVPETTGLRYFAITPGGLVHYRLEPFALNATGEPPPDAKLVGK